ncbi:MAG TPA: MOSC N-terminal beta barrel domain-containing protein [Solirubrobacteraceae bacterium]|nr:MOSC N-terminal beta barrel domain-containing protein [Solirubrobacteraceae bacterium]
MAITVTALRTTPVKALQIRAVDAIELAPGGALGDRAFYVIDERGAMINGKRLGALQTVSAELDRSRETLALHFSHGERIAAPVRLGEEIDTTFFGIERRARLLEGPLSAALSHHVGRELRLVSAGPSVDRGAPGAVSLISRASLERLAHAPGPGGPGAGGADGASVDARRFRMLIEIDGIAAHAEDAWVGRELEVGQARVRIRGHVGRCVTTTRGPESGEVDLPTLKMLAGYRSEEPTTEPLAFGVHGEVVHGGVVGVGDPVRLGPPPR